MRTIYCIVFSIVAIHLSYAQDTLYLIDGSKNIVKIIEVNATQIKYIPGSVLNESMYVVSKDDVFQIVYENGEINSFPKRAIPIESTNMEEDPLVTNFGRNFISISVFELFQSTLTVGYEYTFKSGLFSLRVPISFALRNVQYNTNQKTFGTGLDFNYYPSGQGYFKFFYGPSFEYKKIDIDNYSTWSNNMAFALLLQAGFLVQPRKYFNISVMSGIGYQRVINIDYSNYSYGEFIARLKLNIGYKF